VGAADSGGDAEIDFEGVGAWGVGLPKGADVGAAVDGFEGEVSGGVG
jgi:hypothetical protein